MLREKILATPKELRSKVRAEESVKAINLKRPDKLSFKKKRDYKIVEVQQLENGIAIFARVFENGKQIGFGDGTVDIERFIFVNPPLLVDDENGDIVDTFTDKEGVTHTRRLKEDPVEALKQSLESTVDVMKNKFDSSRIIKGKIGNTTTTVYSDAGDAVNRQSNATWSTLRGATAGSSVASTTPTYVGWEKESASVFNGYQPFHMFDTSSISSGDTISSATFSIYLNGDNAVADSQQLSIANSTQATWNSIITGDFDQRGGSTEGMTRINCPTGATSGYLDFSLNSTGLGFIAKSGQTIPGSASASGKTQLAIRWSSDLDNSTPTGRTYMQIRLSEHTGTASDPKLVVEHAPDTSIATINGLAKASVATVNGLAIASLDTFNGLS